MTLGTGARALRDVAVGATREQAADTFGEYFDDAFFTSYDDFDAEVDLSVLRSVGLVAGDGLSAVLPRVLVRHNEPGAPPPRVLVGMTPDVRHRDTAEQLLASYPSITFTSVLRAGDNLLLPLEHAGDAGPGSRESALARLPAQTAGTTITTPVGEPRQGPGPHKRDPVESTPPAPAAAPLQRGRRGLATVLALGLLVVAATALTVIGFAAGADAVVVTAVLFLAATQCVMLVGLVHVVRLLRAPGAGGAAAPVDPDELAFRKQVRRRTERLVRLSEEAIRLQREDLEAGQKARLEVAGVRKRVMSLGKLLSRTGAAARDDRSRDQGGT
ncbi:MAG: hypothetical protein JWP24_1282 [Marmoricola sp.]|nr:hypothetical protein [Marmoricola sp.]